MRPLSLTRPAAFIAFALLTTFAAAPASAYDGEFDGGGRVGDYLNLVSSANAVGGGTNISGVCASACTMKLGIRNACVRSDAQLLFHAARNSDGSVNALGTLLMLQEYPRSIRAWAISHGALTSTRLTAMSGAQAISLGVNSCDRPMVSTHTDAYAPAAYTPRPVQHAGYCPRAAWSYGAACTGTRSVRREYGSLTAMTSGSFSPAGYALAGRYVGR